MKKFSIYWLYLIIGIVLATVYFMHDDTMSKEVSWTEFETYINKGGVENIVVFADKRKAEGELTDSMATVVFGQNTKPLSERTVYKGIALC